MTESERSFSCESVESFLILLRTKNDRSLLVLEHGIHAYILKIINTLGKAIAKEELDNLIYKLLIVKSSSENDSEIF